ncbi:ATP-grasp domain-containing protein [Variovorax sp. LjRoot84]|uniref:ATP-grasp domain-containing protein n=1 Tax=Variovorax sp. LjRoot84 TaxID=3342340 RepID=UPI003ECEA63B
MKRVLLLLPTTGYRNNDFVAAARTLGVEIVAAANYCHRLAPSWGLPPIMALHFDQPEQAADTVLREIDGTLDAVLAVDDSGVELAALLSERLGLPGNPAHAVRRVRDKLAFRRLLREREFPCPEFHHLPTGEDPRKLVPDLKFPVVVKARRLSGSRGVIRADDPEELFRAVNRVRAIQSRADRDAQELGLIIEAFIPGREYALEGTLDRGELTTLALFDKPDPLDGPYFEETLYVTPSRLPGALQERIHHEVARACCVAGLTAGPVHAEVRVNKQGIWLLEIAARSIGGLCGRVLTHSLGMSLEELILRPLVGKPLAKPLALAGKGGAAGVMMIPIPRRGIYHGLEGLAAAQAVPGVTGVTITAEPGQIVAPPPDGASYLGFIFARALIPADAETALRIAHRSLNFDIRPEYPAVDARRAPH